MKASDLMARCLENEGVEYMFGVPGEEMLDLLDSISRSGIRFVTTRHEQGAAFMADGYGRLTGKAGVAVSTLGPGAMNLATGLADANLDHAPVVHITGQVGLESTHKEFHQYIDTVHSFHPLTKWNARVDTPEVIPEVVRDAFQAAQCEKPGAAHIELPEDVAQAQTEREPMPARKPDEPWPRTESVRLAASLINESRNPVIVAGNGVIRERASGELRTFAERANIPVATTFMGKGAISSRSVLSIGTLGLQARDHISCGFDRADLVITVGYDMVEYSPRSWNPHRDKTIVNIDSDTAHIDSHFVPSAEIVGNIAAALDALMEKVNAREQSDYFLMLKDFVDYELRAHADCAGPLATPQKVIHDIRRVLGDKDILISDVGAHKLWIARMYPAYEPNTVLISNGLAAMGFALPASIAAKLIHPDRRILSASGDGGFLMNAQELETANRLGLKIVHLIFNDNGYGLIRWKQMGKYGNEYGVSFGNPDFVKLAESFGAKGYRPSDASELEPILREAFEQNISAVIDVPVDYGENLKLTERLGQMICPT